MRLQMCKPTLIYDGLQLIFIVDPRVRLGNMKLSRFLSQKVEDFGAIFSGRIGARTIVIPLLDTLNGKSCKLRYFAI
jgi:hypothetical protein